MTDNRVLALSSRPKTFADIVGQATLLKELTKQFSTRPPRAVMLSGQSGAGKTTLARILALAVQYDKTKFGAQGPAEWGTYSDYDINEVNASDVNGVDAIRDLGAISQLVVPPPTKVRVIILDEAHRMTSAAQNTLLKFLEEAPKTTLWIVCTSEPDKLLPAVIRRCVHYSLTPLGEKGRARLVKTLAAQAGFTGKLEDLLDHLERHQITSPGFIAAIAEKYFQSGALTGGQAASDLGLKFCEALNNKSWMNVQMLIRTVMKSENSAADFREIRFSILGYFRSVLLTNGSLQASKVISAFAVNPPFEDPAFSAWFVNKLFELTRPVAR